MKNSGEADRRPRWLDYVAAYFSVPSMEGFSAYRSGWIAHMLFSMLLTVGAWWWAARSGRHGTALVGSALAWACPAVLAGWGIGGIIGVRSHYNPLWILGLIASLAVAEYAGSVRFEVLMLGAATHYIISLVLLLIQAIRLSLSAKESS